MDSAVIEDDGEGEVLAAGIAGEDGQEPLEAGKLISRLRDLLKIIKISPIKCEFIRSQDPKERSVKLDPEHRWNATFQMIERALEVSHIIKALLVNPQFERDFPPQVYLSPLDWKALEEIKNLLEPMAELTEKISGRSYPTLGFALDGVERIRTSLKSCNSDSELIKKVLFFFSHVYLTITAASCDPTVVGPLLSSQRAFQK